MIGRLAAAAFIAVICMSGPAVADPATMKLFDDFDGNEFSPSGGLYYKDTAEQRAGRVEFQSAVKRTGTGALKLSVHPNCGIANDDCSERAEIWEKTALRVPYDKAVWYGFAVKFADPIPQDDTRHVIAQWKREIDPGNPGDFSPFLALRVRKGKLFITVEANYFPPVSAMPENTPANCGPGLTPVWMRPEKNQMRALIAADESWTAEDGVHFNACTDKITVIDRGNPLPAPDSGWIDFAIMTKPGPDGTGHIEILANGKWISTVTGYIGHNDPGLGNNQYFKFGPYRAPGKTEWTLYFDHFHRGPNCSDVLDDATTCELFQ